MVESLLGSDVPCGVIRASVAARINASGSTWAQVRSRFGAVPVSGCTYILRNVIIIGASHQHLCIFHKEGQIEVLAQELWHYLEEDQELDGERWTFVGPVQQTDTHVYILALPESIVDSGIVINAWKLPFIRSSG